MRHDFSNEIPRLQTDCMKWDLLEERFGNKDLLPLWVADMDFRAPEEIINAIKEKADHGVFGYPKPPANLNKSIVQWMKKRHDWDISESSISYALGVVPAISAVIEAFTKENDSILIQTPVYYPFFSVVKKNNRTLVENELQYDGQKYVIDFDDFEKKIIDNQVKMFLFCSPHNPVGRVWTQDELEKIGEICLRHNVLIISDEIHSDLILKGHKHIPLAKVSTSIANITMTCMAASKTFNLAGLQASYMIFTNEEHQKAYKAKLESQALTMVNTFGLVAMEAGYTYGEAWLDDLLEYVEDNIDFLDSFIKNNIPKLKVHKPEGTYLVWVDCRDLGLSTKQLEKLLLNEGKVALNQGYIFGKGGEGFVRINVACPRSILERGLKQIEAATHSLV